MLSLSLLLVIDVCGHMLFGVSLHILLILDYAVKSTREPVLDCSGVLRTGSNNSNLKHLLPWVPSVEPNKSSSLLG